MSLYLSALEAFVPYAVTCPCPEVPRALELLMWGVHVCALCSGDAENPPYCDLVRLIFDSKVGMMQSRWIQTPYRQ